MGFFDGFLGLGGGKQTKTRSSSTTTATMPSWLQGPTQDYLSRVIGLSNQAYTPYGGQTVAGFNPNQEQALSAIFQRGIGGSPLTSAAQGNLMDTISGKFLGQGNPYLTGMIDQAQGDVVRNYNNVLKPQTEAAMARSGSFGNSGLMQTQNQQMSDLQRNLGDISTNMRGQDYSQERNLMQQASLNAPNVANSDFYGLNQAMQAGDRGQIQAQAGLDDAYSRFMEQQRFPYEQAQFLGNALNPLLSTYRGEDTAKMGSTEEIAGEKDRYGGAVSTIASMAAMFF